MVRLESFEDTLEHNEHFLEKNINQMDEFILLVNKQIKYILETNNKVENLENLDKLDKLDTKIELLNKLTKELMTIIDILDHKFKTLESKSDKIIHQNLKRIIENEERVNDLYRENSAIEWRTNKKINNLTWKFNFIIFLLIIDLFYLIFVNAFKVKVIL
jgi:hypothetical protein